MLFGSLVFGTPVGRLQFFGLLLSLCGVVVMITGGHIALLLTLQFNLGDLLMIAAFMAIALLSERLHDYHIVALLLVLTGIALAEKYTALAPFG